MNNKDPTSLPPELQRMVFKFLPKATLKDARLVNKQWNVEAANVLWSHTPVDLQAPRPFEDLLAVSSGGMLQNVKILSITTRASGLDPLGLREATSKLLALLGALPRDCLTWFSASYFKVNRDVLGILLRTQSQLSGLALHLDGEKLRGLPGVNFVRGNLRLIRFLRFVVTADHKQTSRGLDVWFQHAPTLRNLEIIGMGVGNQFEGLLSPTLAYEIKLHRLSLFNLTMSDGAKQLATVLDLPSLQSLEIMHCVNTGLVLHALASAFKNVGDTSLKSFVHDGYIMPKDSCAAAEQLLGSVNGLTEVVLGARTKGTLPRLTSLASHVDSLTDLILCTGSQYHFYSAQDLEYLVSNCKSLKRLALRFGNLHQTVDHVAILVPFDISACVEWTGSLAVLARIPELKRLSLLDEPLLSDPAFTIHQRQWRYAQVAEQIFTFLNERGSKVEYLEFTSTLIVRVVAETDDNGHTWPQYSYQKGTLVIEANGCQHSVRTTAVPTSTDHLSRHLL